MFYIGRSQYYSDVMSAADRCPPPSIRRRRAAARTRSSALPPSTWPSLPAGAAASAGATCSRSTTCDTGRTTACSRWCCPPRSSAATPASAREYHRRAEGEGRESRVWESGEIAGVGHEREDGSVFQVPQMCGPCDWGHGTLVWTDLVGLVWSGLL